MRVVSEAEHGNGGRGRGNLWRACVRFLRSTVSWYTVSAEPPPGYEIIVVSAAPRVSNSKMSEAPLTGKDTAIVIARQSSRA
jgi:hypothetical protein